jgi:hypothetical protein
MSPIYRVLDLWNFTYGDIVPVVIVTVATHHDDALPSGELFAVANVPNNGYYATTPVQ